MSYLPFNGGGVLDPEVLGTGTPDNSNFLRGDGAWEPASGGGGGVSDVTGTAPIASSGGATPAISLNNAGVTYAKIQNVSATDRLLGRVTAGAGVVEEVVCTAAGRAIIDDADATAQRVTLGLGTLAIQSGTFSGTSSGTNTGDQSLAGLQPLDSDLTAIAALIPTNDDVIQRKSGAWTNRSMVQVKTDLALVKGDVGLGSADNTSDLGKPISTATQTALNAKKTDSMATNRLLGRGTAATGVIEEIILGTNLTLAGTTLNASGGGGLTLTTVEINLTQTQRSGRFTITGSGLTTGKAVSIQQANGPYTGKGTREDEAEMDAIAITGKVLNATTIQCFYNSRYYVRGNYKFDYAVSA